MELIFDSKIIMNETCEELGLEVYGNDGDFDRVSVYVQNNSPFTEFVFWLPDSVLIDFARFIEKRAESPGSEVRVTLDEMMSVLVASLLDRGTSGGYDGRVVKTLEFYRCFPERIEFIENSDSFLKELWVVEGNSKVYSRFIEFCRAAIEDPLCYDCRVVLSLMAPAPVVVQGLLNYARRHGLWNDVSRNLGM